MKLKLSRTFSKNFQKRILPWKNLSEKYRERLEIFLKDRNSSVLKDHKLIGRKEEFRAFSITGDVRVVYYIDGENYCFVDIGTHNQVY